MLVATFGDDIEWRCGVYHGLQLSMSGIDVLITFTGAAADHSMDEVVKPYFMYSGLNEQVSGESQRVPVLQDATFRQHCACDSERSLVD